MLLTLKIIWKLGKDKKLYTVKRSVCHRFGGRREGINRWSTKRGWNFSVWFYKGGYTTLYICQNLWHSITLRVNLKSCMHAQSLQSCPTLGDPMDCSPPRSSVHGIFPARVLGVSCHFVPQGIFPTQGWKQHLLCLLHWQAGSLPLSPPGKPLTHASLKN